jgi:hypothetical protein
MYSSDTFVLSILYLRDSAEKLPFNLGEGLSPDALTNWGSQDHEIHDAKTELATKHLLEVRCRDLAEFLKTLKDHELEDPQLSTHFHRYGIGMSHLAQVASYLELNSTVVQKLCENIISRQLKGILRMMLRTVRENGWSSTGNTFNSILQICSTLNQIYRQAELSPFSNELKDKFGEAVDHINLNLNITPKIVIDALHRVGIAMTPTSQSQFLQSQERDFVFIPADIALIYSNIRMPAFIKEAKATYSAFAHRTSQNDKLSKSQEDRIAGVAEAVLMELQRDDPFIKASFLKDLEPEFMKSVDKVDTNTTKDCAIS